MKMEFKFKAASLTGEDNTIIITALNGRATSQSLMENIEEARLLAQHLALWLTPASTNAIVSELNKMDYHG